MIGIHDVKEDAEVKAIMYIAENQIEALGFTEHSVRHSSIVSKWAGEILEAMGGDPQRVEMARIAGYLHDIGNSINRYDHAQSGALMAFTILNKLQMDPAEIALVVAAIGNHDEGTAAAVNPIAAALILSDKSDVRRSRVRDKGTVAADIHDRVNYAVERSAMEIDPENRTAVLNIVIDTTICPVMEYFEIFLTRMVLCRQAAQFLNLQFELIINDTRLL